MAFSIHSRVVVFFFFLRKQTKYVTDSEANDFVNAKSNAAKKCGGVFEQLARYTMRYQESDLHFGLYSSLTC